MNYEWDPDKARSNHKKHGLKFADAVGVFEDENAITIQDEHKHEVPLHYDWQGFPEPNPGCGIHVPRYCYSYYLGS